MQATNSTWQIAVYAQGNAHAAVVLQDGQPIAWSQRQQDGSPAAGDIWRGKITRAMPALRAIFVDIGTSADGLLRWHEQEPEPRPGSPRLVQIRRLQSEGKGHLLTAAPRLAGPFAVFSTAGKPLRRSKLLEFPPEQREQLYTRDLCRLRRIGDRLEQEGSKGAAPLLLLRQDPVLKLIDKWLSPRFQRVIVEGTDLFDEIDAHLLASHPEMRPRLILAPQDSSYGLSAVLGISRLEAELAQPRVRLPGGAELVLEQTCALTAIDVNSRQMDRGKNNESLALTVNRLAAAAIARQISLRDLRGLIVIDFLRLNHPGEQNQLMQLFQAELKHCRVRAECLGFTAAGLFEIIRQSD